MRARTGAERAEALAIRYAVFVQEQGIPVEIEQDGHDEEADHVLILHAGRPVGTGRLRCLPGLLGKLERIAVLPSHRGQGIGRELVLALEAVARERDMKAVVLEPHDDLLAFYRKLGYRRIPGARTVGMHRLITMEKRL